MNVLFLFFSLLFIFFLRKKDLMNFYFFIFKKRDTNIFFGKSCNGKKVIEKKVLDRLG